MAHCTLDQIADYTLGLANAATRERIDRHLASGCERCNRAAAMLGLVRRLGESDAEQAPPAAAVRAVKALGGFQRRRREPRRLRMRVSFDSFLLPQMAATRSLEQSSRHLVFYAEEFALDLRVDCQRSARDLVVVGQLMSRDRGPIGGVPAYLLADQEVISQATTGGLGEFHMAGRPSAANLPRSMRLRLVVDEEQLIEVQLDRVPAARPEPRSGAEIESPPGPQRVDDDSNSEPRP